MRFTWEIQRQFYFVLTNSSTISYDNYIQMDLLEDHWKYFQRYKMFLLIEWKGKLLSYIADNDCNWSNDPGAIHLIRLSCNDRVFNEFKSINVSFLILVNLFVRNINVRRFFKPENVCGVRRFRLFSLKYLIKRKRKI